MEEGKVIFPSMGLRKGKYAFLVTTKVFIYTFILEASHQISLKCACSAIWKVHVLCLKQECVLSSVMLPNMGGHEGPLCLYFGKIPILY